MTNWLFYLGMHLRIAILIAVGMIGGLLAVTYLPIWLSSAILAECVVLLIAPYIVRSVISLTFEVKFKKHMKEDNPFEVH